MTKKWGIEVAVFAGTVGLAAAVTTDARAYELEYADTAQTKPLLWAQGRVGIAIAYDTSDDIDADTLRTAMGRALGAWTQAGVEGERCTSVELIETGAPSNLNTNLMPEGEGGVDYKNTVVWREEEWPEDAGHETLALTTWAYRRSTGEMVDVDIDVNGVDYTWSADDLTPEGANDVANALTHELGHLLGFAHSNHSDSTMYFSAAAGETVKRDLTLDDVLGVCDMYPGDGSPPTGRLPSPPGATAACSVGPAGKGGSGVWVALLMSLGFLFKVRRVRPNSSGGCVSSTKDVSGLR